MNCRIITLLAVCLLIFSVSSIIATDDSQITAEDRTFSATGKSIGYSQDSFLHARLTRDANIQLMQFDVENQNSPVKYNVTISESDYNQLKTAKNQGEIKEIQVKTNQSVVIKEPVIENYTKELFSQDYYDDAVFEKDLKSLEEKLILDSDVSVNVTDHTNPLSGKDYKKITIYKTYYVVKSFRNSSDEIIASVVVNDMQADGKDWVFFRASSLGISGNMASAHIDI